MAEQQPLVRQWILLRLLSARRYGLTVREAAEFVLSSTEEIKRWILGFGREAEVLGPEGLRGEMAEEARLLQEQYGVNRSAKRRAVEPARERR